MNVFRTSESEVPSVRRTRIRFSTGNFDGRNTHRAVVLLAASALLLAGCAEGASGSGESLSGGVEYGATMEEYRAAFEGIEPIVLNAQSPNAKGSEAGRYIERYFEAVDQWSGGTLTFDVAYSSAIAAPTDADNALADGRLDYAQVFPMYEAQEYPATSLLGQSALIADSSPVSGSLATAAWPNEVAFATPEVLAEFEDADMKALVPYVVPGPFGLYCSNDHTDLASLNGAMVGVGIGPQTTQFHQLGATPVSVPYAETYESLQRGVVQCIVSSGNGAVNGGITEVASHLVMNSSEAFAPVSGAMAMSLQTWESLPLVAQQLLWDRLDVFVAEQMRTTWDTAALAGQEVIERGGSITEFEPDALEALSEANNSIFEELALSPAVDDGAAFVDSARASRNNWSESIASTGIAADAQNVDHASFPAWYSPDKIDLEPYATAVYEQIYLPHRPS